MTQSPISAQLQRRQVRRVPTLGLLHLTAVQPSDRTEPHMVIEDNELLLSLMEMSPDHSRCGINE